MREIRDGPIGTSDTKDQLFVALSEQQSGQVQQRAQELNRQVRSWAESIVDILPRGLVINDEEKGLLTLFLAERRRLNLEMDSRVPDHSVMNILRIALPFGLQEETPQVLSDAHRFVHARLDSEIRQAYFLSCMNFQLDPHADQAIQWRAAIRFMAQSIHWISRDVDPKRIAKSLISFELAIVSRDLAIEICTKRPTGIYKDTPGVISC